MSFIAIATSLGRFSRASTGRHWQPQPCLLQAPPGDNLSTLKRTFAVDATSPLATGGCQVKYVGGDVICAGTGSPIGAVLPDGRWFDVELPFAFPFRMSFSAQPVNERRCQTGGCRISIADTWPEVS
jgi:hypothetical protein